MAKVAIVIGATGLVGKALVDQLVDAQHIEKIITITRRESVHKSNKVINKVVNFEHLSEFSHIFNADYFFSCLGTTLKQAGTVTAQRKVDLQYQFDAAQLAANNGCSHYFLVSSSGANEKSNSAYLQMKGELERKIKLLPFKSINIFQPSLLLGDREDFRLAEKIGSWLMPAFCIIPGLKRFRPITGKQVAEKMVLASKDNTKPLETFRLDEIFIKPKIG